MDKDLIGLEDWIQDAVQAGPNQSGLFYRFFKDWSDGSFHNPFLFPQHQTREEWYRHFEWFCTVENFKLPDQPQSCSAVQKPEKALKKDWAPQGSSPTVIFDPISSDQDYRTVIFSQESVELEPFVPEPFEDETPLPPEASLAPGEDNEAWSGSLDDLDSLIIEESQKNTAEKMDQVAGPSPSKTSSPAQPSKKVKKRDVPHPPPPSHHRTDQDRASSQESSAQASPPSSGSGSSGEEAELDLDDLETMTWMDE